MNGSIFLVQPGNTLVELRESGYVTESVLQKYLADHPALLAGEQMVPDAPRRWLLVSQEMGVPDGEESPDRWSVDHLFLDQDAIPTLVETKRSTDSRIRREVIGQMLDYAANGVMYWPIEKLRNTFQISCQKRGVTTDVALADFLGAEADAEEFWQRVEANLKAGRIRMVFVADVIPTELLRIVEFLNKQMDPAEVLAVEVKQFIGEGLTTLVPRVLGATVTAQAKKPTTVGQQWDEPRLTETLISRGFGDCVEPLKGYVSWTRDQKLGTFWGSGSYGAYVLDGSRKYVCGYMGADGKFVIAFRHIKNTPGFRAKERRIELVRRFNRIAGVELAEDHIDGYASFSTDLLVSEQSRVLFFETLGWYFGEVRKAIVANES